VLNAVGARDHHLAYAALDEIKDPHIALPRYAGEVLSCTPLDVFDSDAIAAVASCEHTATRKIVPRAHISNALSFEFGPAFGRVTTSLIKPAPGPYHSARFWNRPLTEKARAS
jgi:hypothetical protein